MLMFQSYVSLPTGRSHVCVRSFWIPFWDDRSVREVFNDLVLARHVIYGHCGVLLVDDLISGNPKNSARWIGRRFPEGHHGHAWICGQAAVTQNVLSDPVSNAGPSNHKVSGSATWLTMDLSWFLVERSMYSCGCPHYRDLLSGLSSITQELCFSEKGIPSKSMCEDMFTYQRMEHFWPRSHHNIGGSSWAMTTLWCGSVCRSASNPQWPRAQVQRPQFIGRDRAHACGWLIKRPWKSSPFISQILEDRVLSKKVVLIVESELFFGCTEVGGIQ